MMWYARKILMKKAKQKLFPTIRKTKIEEIKISLDNIRVAPSPRFSISDLARQTCVACGKSDIEILRYPAFKSQVFAGLVLASCKICGFAWVPIPKFPLDDYYKHHYADDFRVERVINAKFYSPENPIWTLSTHKVRDRAKRHVKALEVLGPVKRVLDLGAGEGLFLHFFDADEKHAVEPDKNSVRILKTELNVSVEALGDRTDYFDLVQCSHTLEHFTYDNIREILEKTLRTLRPGGHFHIEVPRGAVQLAHFTAGKRGRTHRLEPHTLFYSTESLLNLLDQAGFDIKEASVCGWPRPSTSLKKLQKRYPETALMQTPWLTVLARRPQRG
ncbi:MAG: class I SAM-dependent methyltransferase [Rhodobacteraceae bacterium]|nr:class I SAM-dependent methyltransferase [Paracoccaceae bacterium]